MHCQDSAPSIEQLIVQMLAARDAGASICPSEVARALFVDDQAWRAAMPEIRRVAADMQAAGKLRITRGDREVTREALDHGPIRLRRP